MTPGSMWDSRGVTRLSSQPLPLWSHLDFCFSIWLVLFCINVYLMVYLWMMYQFEIFVILLLVYFVSNKKMKSNEIKENTRYWVLLLLLSSKTNKNNGGKQILQRYSTTLVECLISDERRWHIAFYTAELPAISMAALATDRQTDSLDSLHTRCPDSLTYKRLGACAAATLQTDIFTILRPEHQQKAVLLQRCCLSQTTEWVIVTELALVQFSLVQCNHAPCRSLWHLVWPTFPRYDRDHSAFISVVIFFL